MCAYSGLVWCPCGWFKKKKESFAWTQTHPREIKSPWQIWGRIWRSAAPPVSHSWFPLPPRIHFSHSGLSGFSCHELTPLNGAEQRNAVCPAHTIMMLLLGWAPFVPFATKYLTRLFGTSAWPFYCPNTLEWCQSGSQWLIDSKAVATSWMTERDAKSTIPLKDTPWSINLGFLFYYFYHSSPNLTWRDMQHLSVLTSKRNQLHDEVHQWRRNGVGLEFNHLFGYGVLDAGGMVKMAKDWKTVPERFHCVAGSIQETQWVTLNFEFDISSSYNRFCRKNKKYRVRAYKAYAYQINKQSPHTLI